MNMAVRLMVRLYSRLLRFYPYGFRAKFGEEMTAVFIQVIREATERGWLSLTAVALALLINRAALSEPQEI